MDVSEQIVWCLVFWLSYHAGAGGQKTKGVQGKVRREKEDSIAQGHDVSLGRVCACMTVSTTVPMRDMYTYAHMSMRMQLG